MARLKLRPLKSVSSIPSGSWFKDKSGRAARAFRKKTAAAPDFFGRGFAVQ
ncbi:hypothetical protein [Edaphobacter aggregans]|uniref:hypothetical protein n=1 Tax=Edaphobacter aggregans TaxID=570835 RepID=UPI0012FAA74C|nr:hypothetical protein [Edaphobacter aggregans]